MELNLIDEESQSMIQSTFRFPGFVSVIRALVENSVKASADFVEVEIRDERICVKDNGCGISEEELNIKWCNKGDNSAWLLQKISKVSVYSFKTKCFSLKNGKVSESCALPRSGTIVVIENLYHNIPARYCKPSKSIILESIVQIENLIILEPLVYLKIRVNDEVIKEYRPTDTILNRIQRLTSCQNLKAVRFYGQYFSIEGYISEFSDCIVHKNYQFLYSNTKSIIQPDISNRINNIYKDAQKFLSKDQKTKKFPVFVLNLTNNSTSCKENWYFDCLKDLTLMIKEQIFSDSTASKIFAKYLNQADNKREKAEWTELKSFTFSSEIDDSLLINSIDSNATLISTQKKLPKKPSKPKFSYKNFDSPAVQQVKKQIFPASLQNFSYESAPIPTSLYKQVKITSGEIIVNKLVIDKSLGQIDRKFLAGLINVNGSQFFTVFDQHASHERIRLEKLLNELSKGLGQEKCRILVKMTGKDLQKFESKAEKLEKYGFVLRKEEEGFYLVRLPIVFGTVLNAEDFLHAVHEDADIPEPIMNVLKFKACRSAVKFGDPLTAQESQNLIKDLAKCKNFNQCAHGRPTFYPLFKIPELTLMKKPNYSKIKLNCK